LCEPVSSRDLRIGHFEINSKKEVKGKEIETKPQENTPKDSIIKWLANDEIFG
jgi:hypothetical protein